MWSFWISIQNLEHSSNNSILKMSFSDNMSSSSTWYFSYEIGRILKFLTICAYGPWKVWGCACGKCCMYGAIGVATCNGAPVTADAAVATCTWDTGTEKKLKK